MHKSLHGVGLLWVVFLAACTPAPNLEVPAEFKSGQKQFHRACSNCHGSDARGGQTKAPSLIDAEFMPPDFTDDDFRDTIVNGSSSGKMPPQRSSYSDEQITQIIAYLRHSQKAAGLTPEVEVADEEDENDTRADDDREGPDPSSEGDPGEDEEEDMLADDDTEEPDDTLDNDTGEKATTASSET